jgi:hypothetical protein
LVARSSCIPEAIWLKLRGYGHGLKLSIVKCFGLGGRDVANGLEDAPTIESVYPFEGGEFDGLGAAPWTTGMDYLGFEQAIVVSASALS